MIYLDNAATTKPLESVKEKFLQICQNNFANPSSIHKEGKRSSQIIEEASFSFLKYISNFSANNNGKIIFTSSATLSNNIAIKGAAEYLKLKNRNKKIKIMFNETDHPSIVETVKSIKDIQLCKINFHKLYNKLKDNEDIMQYVFSVYCDQIDLLNPDILILQWVNNENGLILPIEKIIEYARTKNESMIIHIDAVQGFLKIPFFNIKNIDTISFSSHKFGGLKGCSILFIKDLKKIKPFIFGGYQMYGIFPSTENVAAISSTISAIEELYNTIELRLNQTMQKKEKLMDLVAIDTMIANHLFILTDKKSDSINFSPYIIKLYNKKIPAQVLQTLLDEKDIMVSIGSACSSNVKKASQDTALFGIPSEFSDKGIRISLFLDETLNQIEIFYQTLKDILIKFQKW